MLGNTASPVGPSHRTFSICLITLWTRTQVRLQHALYHKLAEHACSVSTCKTTNTIFPFMQSCPHACTWVLAEHNNRHLRPSPAFSPPLHTSFCKHTC